MTYAPILLFAAVAAHAGCAGPHYNLQARTIGTVEPGGAHALAVVRIKAPWYAPRFIIRGRFRDAVAEYEAIPQLETKYFTISDDCEFGGLYLWATRSAADGYYDQRWRQSVRERRGVDADVLVFAAPYVVTGRASIEGDPIGARSVSYPATATLVVWDTANGDELARRVAESVKDSDGMIRAIAVVAQGRVGYVALWSTREHAEAALSTRRLRAAEAELGLGAGHVTWFDAPVLIDASLRPVRMLAAQQDHAMQR